jgi:hypothetical protein
MPLAKITSSICRVVSFVETKMLSLASRWFGSPNGLAVEGALQKANVMRVGTTHLDAQGDTASVSKHRPFGAQFAAIGRVSAGFFPRPVAIWSSPRLDFATPTGCLSAHHIPTARPSTADETHPPLPILESNDAGYFRSRTPGVPLSTGNRCAIHRKCRQQLDVEAGVAGLLWDWGDTLVAVLPSAPRVHQVNTMRNGSAFVTSGAPPCKEKIPEKLSFLRMQTKNSSVLG